MKKIILFIFTIGLFSSCEKENTESNVVVYFETKETFTGRTIVVVDIREIGYGQNGNDNFVEKDRYILYREKNSSENYKKLEISYDPFSENNIKFENLKPNTTYEYLLEITDGERKEQSKPLYFTTNIIAIDYEHFFKEFRGKWFWAMGNPSRFSSYNGRTHSIKAIGLEELKNEDIQIFYITDPYKDSIQVESAIKGEYITFTSPKDFARDKPRENNRLAHIGIKVKNNYAYLATENRYTNIDHEIRVGESFGTKYISKDYNNTMIIKVYNPKPHIDSIKVFKKEYDYSCPNYINIEIKGDFLMKQKAEDNEGFEYPILPQKAQVSIFKEDGTIYMHKDFLYKPHHQGCSHIYFSRIYESINILKNYHRYRLVSIKEIIPKGNYSVKIFFIMQNNEVIETNSMNFAVE